MEEAPADAIEDPNTVVGRLTKVMRKSMMGQGKGLLG